MSPFHLGLWPKMLEILKNAIFHQFWCSLYNSAIIRLYASKLKIETLSTVCLYITCQISDCFEKVFGAQNRFRTVSHERFSPKITRFGTIPPLWIWNFKIFLCNILQHLILHICAKFQLCRISKTQVMMLFLRPPCQFWPKNGNFWVKIRHYGFFLKFFSKFWKFTTVRIKWDQNQVNTTSQYRDMAKKCWSF